MAVVLLLILAPTLSYATPGIKSRQAIKGARQEYRETGRAAVILRPTVIRYPYGESIPTFTCAPFVVCDISFLPNDHPVMRLIGDSKNWRISFWGGRTPFGVVYHMAFKPVRAGLRTNVIIGMENGRRYAFNVAASTPDRIHIYSFSFYDPGNWSTALNLPQLGGPDQHSFPSDKASPKSAAPPLANHEGHGLIVDPRAINPGYRLIGDAPWKPTIVYDDGIRVYIIFPKEIDAEFRPVFLLLNRAGKGVTDTYRQVGRRMLVVAHLFRKGELVWGKGTNATRVLIVRKPRHSHWWHIFTGD